METASETKNAISETSNATSESSVRISALFVAAVLAVSLLASLSCAVRKPAVEPLVPERCPSRTMALLEKNADAVHAIKGTLQVRVSAEDPHYTVRVQGGLAAEKPDKARLKIYAGFASLIDVSVVGDSLWAFVPPRSVMLSGSIDEADASFEAGTFLVALREALFPGRFCSLECLTEKSDRGACRIEEDFPGGRRISFIERKSGRLRRMHLVDAEGIEWAEINYSNYKISGKIRFPRDIEISFPLAKFRMRLQFDRVKLNSPLEEDSFRLEVPPGTTVRGFNESQDMEWEKIAPDRGSFASPN